MAEHLIRLRGGWLCVDRDAHPDRAAPAPPPRVTLPVTWPEPASTGIAVRLVRSFGLPPLDPASECLALRLADVGGLVSARLNGREIARPAPGTTALELDLPLPLPPRNELVLDVQLPPAGTGPEPRDGAWGVIALVIGTRKTTADTGPTVDPQRVSGPTPAAVDHDLLGGTVPGA